MPTCITPFPTPLQGHMLRTNKCQHPAVMFLGCSGSQDPVPGPVPGQVPGNDMYIAAAQSFTPHVSPLLDPRSIRLQSRSKCLRKAVSCGGATVSAPSLGRGDAPDDLVNTNSLHNITHKHNVITTGRQD